MGRPHPDVYGVAHLLRDPGPAGRRWRPTSVAIIDSLVWTRRKDVRCCTRMDGSSHTCVRPHGRLQRTVCVRVDRQLGSRLLTELHKSLTRCTTVSCSSSSGSSSRERQRERETERERDRRNVVSCFQCARGTTPNSPGSWVDDLSNLSGQN